MIIPLKKQNISCFHENMHKYDEFVVVVVVVFRSLLVTSVVSGLSIIM